MVTTQPMSASVFMSCNVATTNEATRLRKPFLKPAHRYASGLRYASCSGTSTVRSRRHSAMRAAVFSVRTSVRLEAHVSITPQLCDSFTTAESPAQSHSQLPLPTKRPSLIRKSAQSTMSVSLGE